MKGDVTSSQTPLVTVAIPVYKRFHYLPGVLRSVAAQEYAEIELLVSDNGENGPELRQLVETHYPRPFRFRRNDVTEPIMSRHFNQLVECASGKYFVLLCDDDEIGPRFVPALVRALEEDAEVGVGLPRVEIMDEEGRPLPLLAGKRFPPERFTGEEFVRMWVGGGFAFKTFVTTMARTAEIRQVGGYPDMPTGDDDAVALKLSLGRRVAFCEDAVFRNRHYEASHGLSISPQVLAADIRSWLRFLDTDPVLREYATRHPAAWPEVRRRMIEKAWRTYRHRWKSMYRKRMGRLAWLRAGFALPFIPAYYRWLGAYLLKRGASFTRRLVRA